MPSTQILIWSLRKIAVLVAPLMAALVLMAKQLTSLLHDNQGISYAAAALPLELLAAAGLLRVTLQLLSTMMLGSGRPGIAARLSATTLLLLSGGILIVGFSFSAPTGIIAVSAIWLGIYPFLLLWGFFYLRRHLKIQARDLLQAFKVPFLGIGAMVFVVEMIRHLLGSNDPKLQVAVVVLATALTYAGLFLHGRNQPYQAA